MMYALEGETYTLKEIEVEYAYLCRECRHFGEPAPSFEAYLSEFTEVEDEDAEI